MKMDYSDDWFWLRDKDDKGFNFGDDTAAVSVKTEKREKTADRKFSHWFQGTAAVSAKGEKPEKTADEIALIESLKNIFLNGEYSDVILKVGEQKYPAHKAIITARSSVFRAMLKHEMKEKAQGEINIDDCDPDIFRDFLLYLYTGNLDNIVNENVFELCHMADKYDVKELRMKCVDFIMNNLAIDTIGDAVSVATKRCERELLTRAIAFFTDHAKDIVTTVNWQKFVRDNPVDANELFIRALNKDQSK